MTQGSSFDPTLVTIVLATLAIGLPIVFALAIRFLWERQLNLGRSKDLDKLIWQLHRIASAMEHQTNVSFPAVQPGTEEARDLAYLQQVQQPGVTKPASPPVRVAPPANPVPAQVAQPVPQAYAPVAAAPLAQQPAPQPQVAQAQSPAAQEPAAPPASQPASAETEPEPAFTPIVPHDPAAGPPRHAGVNSMFGL
jgi:hypothetical protein